MKNDFIEKSDEAYKTIGEVARELGLINKKNGSLQTHTIRFWEKQFKQIKPKIRAGNRRYYSKKDFEIIKKVKNLLKHQGLTIKGVQKILSKKNLARLDDNIEFGVNRRSISTSLLKEKLKNISKKLKDLKKV